MNRHSAIDFRTIVPHGGSQASAFEEFCCEIAQRVEDVPRGSEFIRYRGTGGDAGVECVWRLPDFQEWGWQAKFVFDLRGLKPKIARLLKAAKRSHLLSRYILCLPFDLTGPTARTGVSERERFESYRNEWARETGISVELWDASTLVQRLLDIDRDGGRVRFWFEGRVLTSTWFEHHVKQSLKAAGPRYSPVLNLQTPLGQLFQSLGLTGQWRLFVKGLADRATKVARDLRETVHFSSKDFGHRLSAIMDMVLGLDSPLFEISTGLLELAGIHGGPRGTERTSSALPGTRSLAGECRAGIMKALGVPQEFSDTESIVAGMGSPVGRATDVVHFLDDLTKWLDSAECQVACRGTLLLTGRAGVGKTHSICDAAEQRLKAGLPSVLCYGEQFHEGDPWDQIRQIMGLDATWSREALLDALDAAGENSGSPIVIFIDALNETQPRRFWRSNLARFAAQLEPYSWIRLCVSCRSTYEPLCVPPDLEIPRYNHEGFATNTVDACRTFFEYYNLDPPCFQVLHPAFTNPLFLKLICKALQTTGERRLPSGWASVYRVMDEILTASERRFAETYEDHSGARRVTRGMAGFLEKCAAERRNSLPYFVVEAVVDQVVPPSLSGVSVLRWLIYEDILTVVPSPTGDDNASGDLVRVSYELLGEHFLARQLLDGLDRASVREAFRSGGRLHFSVAEASALAEWRGLLEALAVQVAEKCGVELLDLVPTPEVREAVGEIWLDSLGWRSPESMTDRTGELVNNALGDPEQRARSLDALLRMAIRPGHRLSVDWLHRWLAGQSMADRDASWCSYLHDRFETAGSAVHLLLEPPRLAGDVALKREITQLWASALCWFFAAADHRIRDRATKAAVRLTEPHPDLWVGLLRVFLHIDDDYIVERSVVSAYGCLLRNCNGDALHNVANLVARHLFLREDSAEVRNVMIRDHGRCLVNLASRRGMCQLVVKEGRHRPAYPAELNNLDTDDEEGLNALVPHGEDRALRAVYQYFHEGSFRRALADRLGHWLSSLPEEKAHRWILKHVLQLGWNESQHAAYDKAMMVRYGEDDFQPAKRIGEKYQWIALYRLVGRLADLAERKRIGRSQFGVLQGVELRNIDPSDVLSMPGNGERMPWWLPVTYEIAEPSRDDQWLTQEDNPLSAQTCRPVADPHGGRRILLFLLNRWNLLRNVTDGRAASLWIRSFIVRREDLRECWGGLEEFIASQESRIPHYVIPTNPTLPQEEMLEHCYMGEYPDGPGFISRPRPEIAPFDSKEPLRSLAPTTKSVLVHHAGDASGAYSQITLWYVPGDVFFGETLTWDGLGGYRSADGQLCFVDPAMREPGPPALLIEVNYLREFLRRHGLVLVWLTRFTKTITSSLPTWSSSTVLYGRVDVFGEQTETGHDCPERSLVWKRDYANWMLT